MGDQYNTRQAGAVGKNAKAYKVVLSENAAPTWERIAIFTFGVVFVAALVVIAMFFPSPTAFQYVVFRIVLALAAAGIAALVPGFIEVVHRNWVRAGGALAVFVVVYFFSPAALVAH